MNSKYPRPPSFRKLRYHRSPPHRRPAKIKAKNMYNHRPPKYRYICYSCVTGQPVWIYQGQSREGMRKALRRAAKKEQTRARWFQRRVERRTRRIQHLLDECLAAIPILGKLTKEQREAVRRLKAIIAEKQERYSAFYYHIQNTRRRRDKQSCRWHSRKRREMEMREKLT